MITVQISGSLTCPFQIFNDDTFIYFTFSLKAKLRRKLSCSAPSKKMGNENINRSLGHKTLTLNQQKIYVRRAEGVTEEAWVSRLLDIYIHQKLSSIQCMYIKRTHTNTTHLLRTCSKWILRDWLLSEGVLWDELSSCDRTDVDHWSVLVVTVSVKRTAMSFEEVNSV